MFIKTYLTHEINEQEWCSYVENFNAVFEKKYSVEYFEHKYLNSCNGYSYHSFLHDKNNKIVGACTLIPMQYSQSGSPLKLALAVDLFVLPEFRNDSLIFLKLYLSLKKMIYGEEINAVIAVPNANSYLYWKNVIKFKDIGNLSYYGFPVRLGNILNKSSFFNYLSLFGVRMLLFFNSIISSLFNTQQSPSVFELDINIKFLKDRFCYDYETFQDGNINCYYKIVNEEGVNTAYMIYARENGKTTYKALIKGIKEIIKNHKIDLILFIGSLKLFQLGLLKIPKKLEPKNLPLIIDLLNKEDKKNKIEINDIKKWDFGLINYDVR